MSGYDPVAEEYAAEFFDELARKPFDREILDCFASHAGALGPVGDLGCGPGQVARYLAERGCRTVGLDLSRRTARKARALSPGVPFVRGDMRDLPFRDASLGGLAAFYSLIHIPSQEMTEVLSELRRVLVPGGTLLAAFHLGDQVLHLDEWWGHPVDLDFHFFQMPWIVESLEAARFDVGQVWERDPYPEGEVDTRRGYVRARRLD